MADQLKALLTDQVLDVAARAGEKIVDTEDLMAASEQGLAKKRADEPGPSGHKNTLTKMHRIASHMSANA